MLKHTAHACAFVLAVAVASAVPAAAKPVVEVAFVLDTTGSMGGLIEAAKRKIWSIATSIVECSPDAEIRMGLVAYRDIGDVYVTKSFALTTDIQDLYGNLLALRAQGGGDWPESVNEALDVAVRKMAWTHGADTTRIVFLVGDAPPHMDYAQDTKYPDVLAIARQKHITVNAVQAGDARDTARVWRDIAQMGSGEYIPIPQDGGHVVIIETPYDDQIVEIQKKINHTVIPYGSHDTQRRVEEKAAQVAQAPAPAASDMASYLSKRGRGLAGSLAMTGDGDLVADVAEGRQKLAAVNEAELPDDVRAMKPDARQAYLDRQLSERKVLSARLTELVKQRDDFVATEQKKQPRAAGDSFDRVVEATIKKQIGR